MLSTIAAATVIGAHVHTYHFGGEDSPQALRNTDRTPGLYLRTESGLTAGIASNSLKRTSFYLGKTWETRDGRFALTLGAITGYKNRTYTGPAACGKHYQGHHVDKNSCWWTHGHTNAVLRPLIAPSWAWIEARPYLGGATPRVILLGKGVNLAVEWPL